MPDEYRCVNGELKLLERQGEFIFPVEIWMLNDGVNRNNWQFINLEQHRSSWAGVPILVAYTNGGKQIGDGHNMDVARDPATGETVASFTSATAERIVGAISEKPEDIRLADRDGLTWVVGKGFLWAWYARELVKKIERDAEQGRDMSVSIEALVSQSHMEGDVEVEEKYRPLGVTILGDHVMPAVKDAHIAMLSAIGAEFAQLKIRAASYMESEDSGAKEPQKSEQKGCTVRMRFSKQQLRELQERFGENYTVLAATQSDNGVVVCLMGKTGKTAVYVMGALDETIVPSRIAEINAQTHFCAEGCEDVLVDACDMVEIMGADVASLTERLNSATAELAEAKNTITSMREAENRRRVGAAKDKAVATLAAFNANRESKVDEKAIASVQSDIENGLYTASVDADGNWIGDKTVEEKVLAICASAVMDMDRATAKARMSQFAWERLNHTETDDGSVEALLARKGIRG